jgi:N-acetylglucosamine-6-phosphate deacetylase
MNFSIEEAVELTSYNASKYLNTQNIGKLEKGFLSNFLVLDNNLNIIDIYLEGNKVNG